MSSEKDLIQCYLILALSSTICRGKCGGKITHFYWGGAGRSGTTLIRVILDSHDNIACGPELKVPPMVADMWHRCQTGFGSVFEQYHLEHNDINSIFSQMLLALMEKYKKQAQKNRIAEKSPNNIFYFAHLYHIFPKSPLIHIIRDGRDVICSLLTMNWVNPETNQPFEYTRDVAQAANYWVTAVQAGQIIKDNQVIGKNYLEIRYEDIINQPESTLKRLFDFIDEPWDPAVLYFHKQSRNLAGESSASQVSKPLYSNAVGRWQNDLASVDKQIVKDIAGPLLIELGYAQNNDW